MKNSSETIGNRTCDLQACGAVPQPTALPRAPRKKSTAFYEPIFTRRTNAEHRVQKHCAEFNTNEVMNMEGTDIKSQYSFQQSMLSVGVF